MMIPGRAWKIPPIPPLSKGGEGGFRRPSQRRSRSSISRHSVLWLSLCLLTPALAHEVHHSLAAGNAVVVRLTFADGQPFAFEAFEVYAAGSDKPLQVGRTDAQGRVVFLPPGAGELRLRAFSADGHGVDLKLNPPRGGEATAMVAAEDRTSKIVLGAGILLALFGLVQLVLHRKKSA